MDTYEVWVDLKPGESDLELAEAIVAYLEHLSSQGKIEKYRIRRRKFAFAPTGWPEFNISMDFRDLAQLDDAFNEVAARSPEIERLHAEVYSRVINLKAALYRDFPDPVRQR